MADRATCKCVGGPGGCMQCDPEKPLGERVINSLRAEAVGPNPSYRRPILVAAGVGRGSTDKSAFDAALMEAGVSKYNLIPLSSVIPLGAGPVRARPPMGPALAAHHQGEGDWGDRLYCVMACETSNAPGMVAAGIGWSQREDGSGIFVEHHAWTPTGGQRAYPNAEQRVTDALQDSLDEMRARRGWAKRETKTDAVFTAGVVEGGGYVCALVIASVEVQGWTSWK